MVFPAKPVYHNEQPAPRRKMRKPPLKGRKTYTQIWLLSAGGLGRGLSSMLLLSNAALTEHEHQGLFIVCKLLNNYNNMCNAQLIYCNIILNYLWIIINMALIEIVTMLLFYFISEEVLAHFFNQTDKLAQKDYTYFLLFPNSQYWNVEGCVHWVL